MVLYLSQLVISICVLFFVIFYLISSFCYKGNINSTYIKVDQYNIAWKIVSNFTLYSKWWTKFISIEKPEDYVYIEENYEDKQLLKISFYNINYKFKPETWVFRIKESEKANYLVVSKEKMDKSVFNRFLNKMYFNKRDLKKFKKDFVEIYDKVISDS